MPVNESNYKKAEELLSKAQQDQSADPGKVQRLQMELNSFYETYNESTKTPEGHRTEDALGSDYYVEGEGIPSFAYEPSEDLVRQKLSDPAYAESLNIHGMHGDLLPMINSSTDEYKRVADKMWEEAASKAKAEKKSLYRYSKLGFGSDPGKVVAGGLLKHIPAFIMGSADAMSMGTADSIRDRMNQNLVDAVPNAQPDRTKEDAATIDDASPIAGTLGTVTGYANPFSPVTSLTRLGMNKLGYAAASPLTKASIGSGVGGVLSTAEGAVSDTANQLASDQPLDAEFGEQLLDDSGGRFAMGAAGGMLGEILGGLAKGGAKALRETDPIIQNVRSLEDAGGRVTLNPFRPVSVPPNVEKNLEQALIPRNLESPLEHAANKIAPQISDSIEKQAKETFDSAHESLEKYHNSPQGLAPKNVTEPVNFMIDYLRKGKRNDGGILSDAVPSTAGQVRKRLLNEVTVKRVSSDQYRTLKERYGDDVIGMDDHEAKFLLGEASKHNPKDGLVKHTDQNMTILIPKQSNSRHLEMMADELGSMLKTSKGEEKWVRQLDEAFRRTRDRFEPLPGVTPTEAILENGTKLTGLSALQRKHSEAMKALEEAATETGANSKTNILNKVKGFGTNVTTDNALLQEAEKLSNPLESRAKFSDVDSMAADIGFKYQSLNPVEQDSVNRYIRRKDTNTLLSGNDPNFESVLNKFKVSNPTEKGTLYRGQSIDQNQLSKILETGTFDSPGHIPTTYSPDMAGIYPRPNKMPSGHVPVTFKFKSVESGSPMMIDEATKNVEEVIIPKGQYRVVGSTTENGRQVIELTNTPDKSQQLFETAATRAVPILREAQGIPTSFRGIKNAASLRALPLMEAVGGVPSNPFIQSPNSPAGRIQRYLFESSAKNLLQGTEGGYGRFGNEVYDETKQ